VLIPRASPEPQEEATPTQNNGRDASPKSSREDYDPSATDSTLIGSGTMTSIKQSHTYVGSNINREEHNDITKINEVESNLHSSSSIHQQKLNDVDIWSLVPEDDDKAPRISTSLPEWGNETENAIIAVFLKSSILSPLYTKALQLMPEEQFINYLGRLLEVLHKDLVTSNDIPVIRQLAEVLHSRQRRSRIARMIVGRHISSQGSWDEEHLADVQDQERRAYASVESWLKNLIIDSVPAITRTFNLADESKASGTYSDSYFEDEALSQEFVQYPKLGLMAQAIVNGKPFQNMLTNLKEFLRLLPQGLLKELLPIPRGNIIFDTTGTNTLFSTVQGFLEDVTVLEWDWWPMPPRMRPLKPGETRVHWLCVGPSNLLVG
jgi:hypothetical protein